MGVDHSLGEDFPEDGEEFLLLDGSVSVLVDCGDELLDVVLAGLILGGVQVLHGGADESVGLLLVEGSGVVLVELSEDGIDCLPELVVRISHVNNQIIPQSKSTRLKLSNTALFISFDLSNTTNSAADIFCGPV